MMSPKEKAQLELRLAQLEALHAKRAQNGGREASRVWDLKDRIHRRLNPYTVDELEAEAASLIALHPPAWIEAVTAGEKT
jgi:hypothetical protein